jgi:phage head maturation protease
MPKPRPNESESEFLDRCVETLMDDQETDDADQAAAICEDIWNRERGNGMRQAVIYKTHASNAGGGTEFVLSDNSVDRAGDVIEPSGWDLRQFSRNSVCLFGHNSSFIVGKWHDVKVVGNELRGKLELAPRGTSARIDEIRRLVEADILRSVSVGFRAIASEPLKDGAGTRFLRQELVEASLVAIPCNANCLAVAKSLRISDATQRLIFTEQSDSARRQRARELRARSYRLLNDAEYLRRLRKRDPAAAADLERRIREFGLTPRGP